MRGSTPPTTVVLAVLCLATIAGACGTSSPSAPSTPGVTLPSLDSMLADKVIGDASAPITMIDFSSLDCSHCANFHTATLPFIKTNYVDTGKVRIVSREFPLGSGAPLSAAMLARCAGNGYARVIDLLYSTQSIWSAEANPTAALKSAVFPAMPAAVVDACLADSDLRNGLWAIRTRAVSDYGITGTPTFVINGRAYVGDMPYSSFDAVFKSLLP
jgi:protein-disulfide isomerase